ncbi:MAG TPA: hypothetical protein VGF67_04970 [Ktedonobacteraceae bacterium]|jgi:hypothetical protein
MDVSELAKRSGLRKEQAKGKNGGSSGVLEREVERLNERGWKPMKSNLNRWSS